MQEEHLLLDKEEGIATVTINRPEQRNAITSAMWEGIAEIMRALEEDPATRVVILRGAGDKAFASGADISELTGLTARETHARQVELLENAFNAIINYRNPVIAMVNGFCMGAGCQLACVCDMRIVSDRSKFGIPAAKLGLVLNYPMTKRLTSLVGPTVAKEILFTGDAFDAQRALQMGLVNRVVPAEQLKEVTHGVARMIAENAPLSVRGAKMMVARAVSYQEGIDHADLDELEMDSFESEDAAEGLRAFLEKRKAQWKDR
ncbi:MAG: enoyl-CoA hydratase-related protein [Chloroflexi bacterium]|nr:enoyl-CoA hydratase-related protein [Chloroflexota bacterium]